MAEFHCIIYLVYLKHGMVRVLLNHASRVLNMTDFHGNIYCVHLNRDTVQVSWHHISCVVEMRYSSSSRYDISCALKTWYSLSPAVSYILCT